MIADDHAVVRMAVRLLLQQGGHEVIGEADAGVEVIALARSLNPDLVILDIDMPKLDGFAVLQRLCSAQERTKVVIFSGLDASRYAIRCSRAGASGFVSKDGDINELLSAVQIVLAGYTLFPTTDFSSVDSSSRLASEEALLKTLSDRELAVLRNLARGHRIKDIAHELMLSEKTASTYKARLIVKLQVGNFLELVEFAKRNGLI
ncbi:response regulator transcription factor [Pseudomonas arsenicoxydans]|uniref:response regulator transcription factor n=1 Tax=Pseudomonas arsenicoxydans TaxID=702115 RepID=UPI0023D923F5|nr:response regulator transcription factor [Pseudomonas arsenicoxydans]